MSCSIIITTTQMTKKKIDSECQMSPTMFVNSGISEDKQEPSTHSNGQVTSCSGLWFLPLMAVCMVVPTVFEQNGNNVKRSRKPALYCNALSSEEPLRMSVDLSHLSANRHASRGEEESFHLLSLMLTNDHPFYRTNPGLLLSVRTSLQHHYSANQLEAGAGKWSCGQHAWVRWFKCGECCILEIVSYSLPLFPKSECHVRHSHGHQSCQIEWPRGIRESFTPHHSGLSTTLPRSRQCLLTAEDEAHLK